MDIVTGPFGKRGAQRRWHCSSAAAQRRDKGTRARFELGPPPRRSRFAGRPAAGRCHVCTHTYQLGTHTSPPASALLAHSFICLNCKHSRRRSYSQSTFEKGMASSLPDSPPFKKYAHRFCLHGMLFLLLAIRNRPAIPPTATIFLTRFEKIVFPSRVFCKKLRHSSVKFFIVCNLPRPSILQSYYSLLLCTFGVCGRCLMLAPNLIYIYRILFY